MVTDALRQNVGAHWKVATNERASQEPALDDVFSPFSDVFIQLCDLFLSCA